MTGISLSVKDNGSLMPVDVDCILVLSKTYTHRMELGERKIGGGKIRWGETEIEEKGEERGRDRKKREKRERARKESKTGF